MHILNHANLTTYDVPSLRTFLERVFNLHTLETRGDKFAILQDQAGFLLALMFDKHMTSEHGYPGFFHVGFLQDSRSMVDECHAAVESAGYEAPSPALLQRGGPPTYGFYCNAPGGVTVEISTMNI
ncbi:VOC family protein [Silvibacterium acidisoli]|uniref:VOC family protein n=1 Tax=Acidobacteriaceae bacterium ZG23-2 TaxID=2883246 RepID=UPI00406CBBD6